MNADQYRLMLVTHKNDTPLDEYLEFIQICAKAGITAVQLREKNATHTTLTKFGRHLKDVLAPFHIPLIVNDNVDLALELDADGVHLGQTDLSPIIARQRLGAEKIIGLSIDLIEQLHLAENLPIDYVGIGAIFKTATKTNVQTTWGIEKLQQLSNHTKHPIIAIGGIYCHNAASVIQAGAHGIAIIDAIHASLDPANTIKTLLHHICPRNSHEK